MSYDIYLTDPVTRDPIELEEAHYMRGGTYPPERHNGGVAEHYLQLR